MKKHIDKRLVSIKTGNVDVSNVDTSIKKALCFFSPPSFIQLVPLSLVVSETQLQFALSQSLSAFESGENFSSNLSLEFLSRLLGTKQIGNAISSASLVNGENNVAVVIYCDSVEEISSALDFLKEEFSFCEQQALFEKALQKNFKKIQKFFDISDNELSALNSEKFVALEKAVLERVALVSL